MSIKIGDKNKIKNSVIGHQFGSNNENIRVPEAKKTYAEKHPILISSLVSLIVGFILLFSFWKTIIDWLEGLF